jgi:hypothetical protein
MSNNSRLEYWKEKARQAEADFYAVSNDQNKADTQVLHLADMIRANREIDRLTNGVDFDWLYNTNKTEGAGQ